MEEQRHIIHWQGIEIEAIYQPNSWGGVIAHLALHSINPPKARLPMTETGYRSHYHQIGTIEEDFGGDVVAYVTHWLDEEAQSKSWKKYIQESKQGDLFG